MLIQNSLYTNLTCSFQYIFKLLRYNLWTISDSSAVAIDAMFTSKQFPVYYLNGDQYRFYKQDD